MSVWATEKNPINYTMENQFEEEIEKTAAETNAGETDEETEIEETDELEEEPEEDELDED